MSTVTIAITPWYWEDGRTVFADAEQPLGTALRIYGQTFYRDGHDDCGRPRFRGLRDCDAAEFFARDGAPKPPFERVVHGPLRDDPEVSRIAPALARVVPGQPQGAGRGQESGKSEG